MTDTKRKKELVTAGDPEAFFTLPLKDDWADEDFLLAPNLAEIGEELIAARPELNQLEAATIVYVFKRKGPEAPRKKLGTCQKPSGLLQHFSKADFIVCLMANNCFGMTRWQVEALVYHELKHAGISPGGKWVTVPHDCECFAQEIERYGLWKGDLAKIAKATEQAMQLPFELGIERGSTGEVPPNGKGIDSMTISLPGGESVMITSEDVKHIRASAKKNRQPETRA